MRLYLRHAFCTSTLSSQGGFTHGRIAQLCVRGWQLCAPSCWSLSRGRRRIAIRQSKSTAVVQLGTM